MSQEFATACPYDDCENTVIIPRSVEQADIIVCRTNSKEGCNRNTEVVSVEKDDDGAVQSISLDTLEVDEDWGE